MLVSEVMSSLAVQMDLLRLGMYFGSLAGQPSLLPSDPVSPLMASDRGHCGGPPLSLSVLHRVPGEKLARGRLVSGHSCAARVLAPHIKVHVCILCCVQGHSLLYLDPHTIQAAGPLSSSWSTYFCETPRLVPMSSIDPSLALGFYCKDQGG